MKRFIEQENVNPEDQEQKSLYSSFRKNSLILVGAVIIINIIFLIGLLAIADFGKVLSQKYGNVQFYYPFKQIIIYAIALVFMLAALKYKNYLHKLKWGLYFFSVSLLVITLIQGSISGFLVRYFCMGGICIKSGIWAVLLILPLFSHLLSSIRDKATPKRNYLSFILYLSIINSLLLLQKDVSIFILFNFIIMIGLLYTKITIVRKILVGVSILIPLVLMISISENNREQLQTDIQQLVTESKIVNSNRVLFEFFTEAKENGLSGHGFGHYKNQDVTTKMTDDVLWVTSWQFGIWGLLTVFSLFGLLLWIGRFAVRKCTNQEDKALAFLMLLLFGFQVISGLIHNLDLLPYSLRYGVPIMSFKGTTSIVYFISIGAVLSSLLPEKLNSYKAEASDHFTQQNSTEVS